MNDYAGDAGRLLADRYRLPRPLSDEFELAETVAYDTASGQRVLVRQVPLPEVVEGEVVEDGDPGGYGAASGGRPGGGPGRATRSPADPTVRRAVEAALAASRIPDHPRLDQVFDVFVEGDGLWIVSELVPARPLSALLADRPLSAHRAAEIAADLLAALRTVHGHGWTHRNITARTVLICEDGRALLSGLAVGAAQEALCGYDPFPPGPASASASGEGPGDGSGDAGGSGGPAGAGGANGATGAGAAAQVPPALRGPVPPVEAARPVPPGGRVPGVPGVGTAVPPGVPVPPGAARAALAEARDEERAGVRGQDPDSYPYGTEAPGAPWTGGRESRDPATWTGEALPDGFQARQDERAARGGYGEYAPYRDHPVRPGVDDGAGQWDDEPSYSHDDGYEDGYEGEEAAGERRGRGIFGFEGLPPDEPDERDGAYEPEAEWEEAPGGRGQTGPPETGASASAPSPQPPPPHGAGHPGQGGGPVRHGYGHGGATESTSASPAHVRAARRGAIAAYRAGARRAVEARESDRRAADRAGRGGGAGEWWSTAPERALPDRTPPSGPAPAPDDDVRWLPPAGDEVSPTSLPGARHGTSHPVRATWRTADSHSPAPEPHTAPDAAPAPAPSPDPAPVEPEPEDDASRPWGGADGADEGRYRGPATALAAERARQARMTVVGPVTERWAPEQAGPVYENWRLAPPVGPAADLWALGVLLFRAVQGHAPYPEDSAAELAQMVCSEPPAFAEDCGPLRPVVESLMRQDPTERPDFEELRGWLRSLTRSAPEPDVGRRTLLGPPSLDSGASSDPRRLPIVRRRGWLVRRRKADRRLLGAAGAERHRHKKSREKSAERREQRARRERRTGSGTRRVHEMPPVPPARETPSAYEMPPARVRSTDRDMPPSPDRAERAERQSHHVPPAREDARSHEATPFREPPLRDLPPPREAPVHDERPYDAQPYAPLYEVPVDDGPVRQRQQRPKEKKRARQPRTGSPRSLGRLLLGLVLFALTAAVLFAMWFMPKGEGGGATQQKGSVEAPGGQEEGDQGDKGQDADKGGSKGEGEDKNPPNTEAPQTTAPPAERVPEGYKLSKDPAGFQIAVPEEWDRRSTNGRGQVRYNGGQVEMVIVNGRDTTKKYGKDPSAYQSDDEPELAAYRSSDWATTSGLRRIDVGDTAMAEGTFGWRDSGRQVYARNRAMILDGRYHVLLVMGSENKKKEIDRTFEAVADTYRVTARSR
ncbi:hypothetical protein [Streptomyces daliensis]